MNLDLFVNQVQTLPTLPDAQREREAVRMCLDYLAHVADNYKVDVTPEIDILENYLT